MGYVSKQLRFRGGEHISNIPNWIVNIAHKISLITYMLIYLCTASSDKADKIYLFS